MVWFGAWALAGAMLALGLMSVLATGIGVVLLVPAVFLVRFIRSKGQAGAELLGLVVGAGALVLLIGVLNLDYVPCPPSGAQSVLDAGDGPWRCGGLAPVPWLLSGAVLVSAGLIARTVLRRRSIRAAR